MAEVSVGISKQRSKTIAELSEIIDSDAAIDPYSVANTAVPAEFAGFLDCGKGLLAIQDAIEYNAIKTARGRLWTFTMR